MVAGAFAATAFNARDESRTPVNPDKDYDDRHEAPRMVSLALIGGLIGSAVATKVTDWQARKAVSAGVTGLYLQGRR
jgi:hypothetical protein